MWGCFLMSGVKLLHFLKDWWKSITIHQNYTMALKENTPLKVIWSVGKGSEIFRENSHLFDFHLKACYKCMQSYMKFSPEMYLVFVEFEARS